MVCRGCRWLCGRRRPGRRAARSGTIQDQAATQEAQYIASLLQNLAGPVGQCPKCGSPVVERFKSFTCTNEECDFTIWKTIAGRLLSREEFEALVRDKQTGPLGGFRSRKGKRFHAALKLSDDFKAEFDFGPNGQENGAAQPVDFSQQESLGTCPKCGGRVFESGMTYVCENSVGPTKTCDFRSGKVILQRPIEREQMNKLLASGKTDLLERFISRKGRPFSPGEREVFAVAHHGEAESLGVVHRAPHEHRGGNGAAVVGHGEFPKQADFKHAASLGRATRAHHTPRGCRTSDDKFSVAQIGGQNTLKTRRGHAGWISP